MSARRATESRVFFPWDRRRPRVRALSRRNARLGALVAGVALVVWGLMTIEHRRRAVFATRATIGNVMRAIQAYRADHDGACPPATGDLLQARSGRGPYLQSAPLDAWGREFRIQCPGRKHPQSADVVSAGPSGNFEGRDQIE